MKVYKVLTGHTQLKQDIEVVCWFSGGVTSAVACYLALQEFGDKCVIATIRLESEDDDNWRFLEDCENRIFNQKVVQIQHANYKDPLEIFRKKRMFQMQGLGAPCTMILKKQVRQAFEKDYCLFKQVFGYDASEIERANRFLQHQPEVELLCPLIDQNIEKQHCFEFLKFMGVKPPTTYQEFNNANCLKSGCIKGGRGYWNHFRQLYPERFEVMAALEDQFHEYYRSKGLKSRPTVLRGTTLRNLPPNSGRHMSVYTEEHINCDFTCAFEKTTGDYGVKFNEIKQLSLF